MPFNQRVKLFGKLGKQTLKIDLLLTIYNLLFHFHVKQVFAGLR
jgi:hypothetical protein